MPDHNPTVLMSAERRTELAAILACWEVGRNLGQDVVEHRSRFSGGPLNGRVGGLRGWKRPATLVSGVVAVTRQISGVSRHRWKQQRFERDLRASQRRYPSIWGSGAPQVT